MKLTNRRRARIAAACLLSLSIGDLAHAAGPVPLKAFGVSPQTNIVGPDRSRAMNSGPCTSQHPDMTITDITWRPISDGPNGHRGLFTVIVKNLGKDQPGTMQSIQFFHNNVLMGNNDPDLRFGRLRAGEQAQIDGSSLQTQGEPTGSYTAVYVPEPDTAASVDCNPNNNRLTKFFDIRPVAPQVGILQSTLVPRKPDLIPVAVNLRAGTIGVRNVGNAAAAPSKLTISCHKVGHVGPGGGCPDAPGLTAYNDPAFPDRATLTVPALAPGANFVQTLSFWNSLKWAKGEYQFTLAADAANTVAENNELNNSATSTVPLP
jgi:hypothetical protein